MAEETAGTTPTSVQAAGVMMMIAGFANIGLCLMWSLALVSSCYLCICAPLPLIFAFGGLFELVHGLRLVTGQRVEGTVWVSVFGIVTGLMSCMGVVPLVCEIVAIVMITRPDAQEWLAGGEPAEA